MLLPATEALIRYEGRPVSRTRARARLSPATVVQRSAPEEEQLSPEEQALVDAILRGSGLRLECYRPPPLKRRVHAVLRLLRCHAPQEALHRLAESAALRSQAVDTLLIGHTHAFRDAFVFEQLAEQLALRGAAPRVWSVGCSSGVELGSVALLLARQGNLQGAMLRGTDCRRGAIERARRQWGLKTHLHAPGLKPPLSAEHFAAVRAVAPHVRWDVADIFACREEQAWDVILCRNVSIYFQPEAGERLWHLLAAALKPGGLLVTGKAERLPRSAELVLLSKCIYQRRETRT